MVVHFPLGINGIGSAEIHLHMPCEVCYEIRYNSP